MAKIVLAVFGSLGDLHPMIALALELRRRGHEIVFATSESYREKIEVLGLALSPMRPDLNPEDRELARRVMDAKSGTEILLKEILMPNLRAMYDDLLKAVAGADLLINGEVVYAAKSVAEKTGIKWISTSLAPISLFSAHDPNVYPTAQWYENLRFMPVGFHRSLFGFMRWTIRDWLNPYKEFRRALGLDENHDPIFYGKNSNLLHLAMFSKVLAKPQTDWHSPTLQTGFCFYDGQDDLGKMPRKLNEFLAGGDAPIIFTLGSAAAMDARDFFEESAKAAKLLNKRAVLLYGIFNQAPKDLPENVIAFDYAPYSLIFPKAACVVHQGGIGTTSQVLRAGVPMLVMPYSHDQPDNAARCIRLGVARRISRDDYNDRTAAREIGKLLANSDCKANAARVKNIVISEHGTKVACDGIENVLNKSGVK